MLHTIQAELFQLTRSKLFWIIEGLLALKDKQVFFLLQGSQPSKEVEMLDYVMNRFCSNYGLQYQGLAVSDYELNEIEGWELAPLQEKLAQVGEKL